MQAYRLLRTEPTSTAYAAQSRAVPEALACRQSLLRRGRERETRMSTETRPFGAGVCRKCKQGIAFAVLPSGRYCPVNPDGTEHWDACRQAQRAGKPPAAKPPLITESRHKVFYPETAEIPPWDESLGVYRCFEGCC